MDKKAEDVIEEIFQAARADDNARPLEAPLRQLWTDDRWTAERISEARRQGAGAQVKRRKLRLADFRGARDRKLKDKNYFVYAENGRGKSTIADRVLGHDNSRQWRMWCLEGLTSRVSIPEGLRVG